MTTNPAPQNGQDLIIEDAPPTPDKPSQHPARDSKLLNGNPFAHAASHKTFFNGPAFNGPKIPQIDFGKSSFQFPRQHTSRGIPPVPPSPRSSTQSRRSSSSTSDDFLSSNIVAPAARSLRSELKVRCTFSRPRISVLTHRGLDNR